MRHLCRLALLLWLLGAGPGGMTAPGPADLAEWEPRRVAGGIELYRQPVTGSRFPALAARTRFPLPATAVYRIVSDYDHFPGFVPAVRESRVLERNGATARVYQRLALPAWFADRHYVLAITDRLAEAEAGRIGIDWALATEETRTLPQAEAVIPATFTGSWRLMDTAGGRACEAVYAIHVEPGGRVPAWLFGPAAERYVIDVVAAVRRRLAGQD
jgi:ribosome-associated toxin RatA of RatAB toxin-antitoxin module